MFPNLLKMNESPPISEATGIGLRASETVLIRESGMLPVHGVLRTRRESAQHLIQSMILVVCYGRLHIPYTGHPFKDVIAFEDDMIPCGGEDVCFYFNVDAFQVCRLKPTPGTYYVNASTEMIQSNVIKVLVT